MATSPSPALAARLLNAKTENQQQIEQLTEGIGHVTSVIAGLIHQQGKGHS